MRWLGVYSLVLALCATSFAKGKTPDPDVVAVTGLLEKQFVNWAEVAKTNKPAAASVYAKGAMLAMTGSDVTPQVTKFTEMESKWAVFGPSLILKHKIRDVRFARARDGKSAWVTFNVKVGVDGLYGATSLDLRASQLLFKTERGWVIGSGAWSFGQKPKTLAKAIADGTLEDLEPIMNMNIGERDVLAAADAFLASGLDDTAIARKDVLAIGGAPGELLVGGKAIAKTLSKIGSAKLNGAMWAVTAPSGTTACATANVLLNKGIGDAALPARVFVVFDKDTEGNWSAVHVHLAHPSPAT